MPTVSLAKNRKWCHRNLYVLILIIKYVCNTFRLNPFNVFCMKEEQTSKHIHIRVDNISKISIVRYHDPYTRPYRQTQYKYYYYLKFDVKYTRTDDIKSRRYNVGWYVMTVVRQTGPRRRVSYAGLKDRTALRFGSPAEAMCR